MMKRANSGINPVDLVDRISVLPDSILSLILSFISTKNAVATSVLSKRWKSLWKSVHNLDFNLDFCEPCCYKRCDKDCAEGWSADEDMKFACFVNHVLLLHDGGFLNKFSLVWKPLCIPSHVISWISTAITRNVHELYLCVNNSDEPFEIPSSVFGCETLKSLQLDGNVFVLDSIDVCLPRLEMLRLVSVYFHSDETFQKLISGCPVLKYLVVEMDMDIMTEYLIAYRDTATNLFNFVVSSTSLIRFMLSVQSEHIIYEDLPYCSLELEAPSLENFRVEGFVPQIFVRESLSSLVKADFSLSISEDELSDANICNSLVEAIRACDCVEELSLSKFALSALSRATIGLSTKFENLTELKAEAECGHCTSIQDFLQSSDYLEELIISKDLDSECLHHDNGHTHSNWTTRVEVPRCLSNSLNWVQFYGYGGLDYEREMICYMLMHGSALEYMTIYCDLGDDEKLKLVQEICSFPRKSPACKVDFTSLRG